MTFLVLKLGNARNLFWFLYEYICLGAHNTYRYNKFRKFRYGPFFSNPHKSLK